MCEPYLWRIWSHNSGGTRRLLPHTGSRSLGRAFAAGSATTYISGSAGAWRWAGRPQFVDTLGRRTGVGSGSSNWSMSSPRPLGRTNPPDFEVDVARPAGYTPAISAGGARGRRSATMSPVSGRWNLVVVLALACGTPALAAPPAEHAPFDLTYLPPDCVPDGQPQILVALRPAELFARPDGKKAAAAVDQLAMMMATQIYGITNTPGPGVEALDTVLLSGYLTLTHNPGAPRPHTLFGAASGIVLRTRDQFDWATAVARWSPAGKPVTHRDATFTTVPAPALFALMTPAAKDATYSLYVADERTLVVGPEDSIRKLIDRLKDGKPAPQPAGWSEVERAAVAVAVTTTDKAAIDKLPKPTDEATRTAFRLAKATDGMAGGVWCADTTMLR